MKPATTPIITQWGNPAEIIRSGYGNIPYRDWCERERARMNRRGDKVKIMERSHGTSIALARERQ